MVHAGPLFRQTENSPLKRAMSSWKQLWVVLFDNYRKSSAARRMAIARVLTEFAVVMAKQKGHGADARYVVWKPVRALSALWCTR